MNPIQYVRNLLPIQERKEVLAALSQLQEELQENTLPVAVDVQEIFAGVELKSNYAQTVSSELRRRITFQGNGLDMLVMALAQLNDNIGVLEAETKRVFSVQFSSTQLTYNRVNLLRYIDSATFYVRYFRKLALRLVAEEALVVGGAAPVNWSKAEREWLDSGLRSFAGLYRAMAMSEAKLRQALQQTTNAEIDESTYETAVKAIGGTKIDPMELSNFAPTSNPLFSLGKTIAEWKVKRYQAAKEEHQALQLRIQEMRELRDTRKSSPKLQNLIKHTEQRIEQLDYRLAKIEEDAKSED